MDESAFFESEQGLAVIAVAVLLDGVPEGLVGERILQFGRGDRKAVETEQDVDGLLMLEAEMNLAGDGEAVGFVELRGFGIEPTGRGEIGEVESLSEEIEAMAEYVEGAARIEREGEFIKEGFGGVRAVVSGDGLP